MKYEKGDKFKEVNGEARAKIVEKTQSDVKGYILWVVDEYKAKDDHEKASSGYEHPVKEEELEKNWKKDNRIKVEGYY